MKEPLWTIMLATGILIPHSFHCFVRYYWSEKKTHAYVKIRIPYLSSYFE